jgi:hypothetical protein
MHWLDPDFLPATEGTLDRFLFNTHADIDGLLLTDGTEIHTPPHLSAQLLDALAPGEKLSVRGVKTRHGGVIVAVAIDTRKGGRIADEGPKHKKHPKPHPHEKPGGAGKYHGLIHQGIIERLLHGPKGDAHGALLDDGTIVRFPPHGATTFADVLKVGASLSSRGASITTPSGTVVDATALGVDASSLLDVPKDPKHGPKKPPKKPGPKEHAHHA